MAAIVQVKDIKALAAQFNSVNEIRVGFVELLKTARQENHPQIELLPDFSFKLYTLYYIFFPYSILSSSNKSMDA